MSTTVKIPSIEVTFLFCNPLTLYYRVRYNRNSTHPISLFTFTKHTQKIEYEITSADDYDNSDSKISKEALTDFEEGETLFSLVHDLFSTMTIIFLDYIFQSSSLLKYIFIKQKIIIHIHSERYKWSYSLAEKWQKSATKGLKYNACYLQSFTSRISTKMHS